MRISDWSSDVCSSDLLRCQELRLHCVGKDGRSSRVTPSDDHYICGPEDRADAEHRQHAGLEPEHGEYRTHRERQRRQIGRASCRERVWQYVSISVVEVPFKKKKRSKKRQQPEETET